MLVKAKLIDYAIFYHNLKYTIPVVGHGEEVVPNTYKS